MRPEPPETLAEICRDLGVGLRARARMIERDGEPATILRLQKMWLKYVPERTRLLAKDSSHGYTDQPTLALRAEPEAVAEADQRRISAAAHQNEANAAVLAEAQREQVSLEQRLENVRTEAQRRKI